MTRPARDGEQRRMPSQSDYLAPRLGPCSVEAPPRGNFYRDDDDAVLVDASTAACRGCEGRPAPALEAAGPRRRIFFDPARTRAAIVTCGGLCPGLNDVIRALTMVLWHRYGVRHILGLRYGYQGLVPPFEHDPLELNPDLVADIHKHGGTILGTSRGHRDVGVMADFLRDRGINILFPIGGDGTQRAASLLAEEARRRNQTLAVVGIPKTIDNDIACTERTFGFETAVALSLRPVEGAHMEAKGVLNGVGLVKLMGRESGFVAAYAALASSDVNLVLIPEVPFTLPQVLSFLEARLARKAHAVIVVAEGAGQDLVPSEGEDASGNRVFGDIGLFLKAAIGRHFAKRGIAASVKYIDPSYTIRSAQASPDDSVFCFQLAENAVHAAMAGRTAMVVGLWNGRFVHVPTRLAVDERKRVDPAGPLWQSVLENTGQPF
jgi:6-phosphofructokinase 1